MGDDLSYCTFISLVGLPAPAAMIEWMGASVIYGRQGTPNEERRISHYSSPLRSGNWEKTLVQDTSLEGLRSAYKRQYFNEDGSLA